MQIYEYRSIGKGHKIVNLLFHKSDQNIKSFYHKFWIKYINNIKQKQLSGGLFEVCAMRHSVAVLH